MCVLIKHDVSLRAVAAICVCWMVWQVRMSRGRVLWRRLKVHTSRSYPKPYTNVDADQRSGSGFVDAVLTLHMDVFVCSVDVPRSKRVVFLFSWCFV